MSDDTSIKAYWGQLVQKRYWREVVIGMPPKDPWPPTGDMLIRQFDRMTPVQIAKEPASLDMVVACNATYMEVADGRYMRRGFGGMMYTLMEIPALILAYFALVSLIWNVGD